MFLRGKIYKTDPEDYTVPIYTEILIRCRDGKIPYLKENRLYKSDICLSLLYISWRLIEKNCELRCPSLIRRCIFTLIFSGLCCHIKLPTVLMASRVYILILKKERKKTLIIQLELIMNRFWILSSEFSHSSIYPMG